MKFTAMVIMSYLSFTVILFFAVANDTIDDATLRLQKSPKNISAIITTLENKDLIPNQLSDSADSFVREAIEYIMVSIKLNYRQVKYFCQDNYGAILALISDRKIADFLAEALMETNLELDSLWIGGEYKTIDNDTSWYWTSHGGLDIIDPVFFKSILANVTNKTDNIRDCLAFGRSDKKVPQFRPLDCSSMRSFICQRKRRGGGGEGNSTHIGWIKIAKKLYKIYHDAVSWEKATGLCAKHNVNAELAMVPNCAVSQILGRFLLIGRPSLENAWIGARYENSLNGYIFESEDEVLPNVTNTETHYPPWKNKQINRRSGCILLDRHLADDTLFVEARCERLRSYICSVDASSVNGGLHYVDVFIEHRGYRVYLDGRSWHEALQICFKYCHYHGQLVEIITPLALADMTYLMGEVRKDIQHLWIGGKYDKTEWVWATSGHKVDKSILNFVKNDTYIEEAEATNLCLNMDRDYHTISLHYGTECSWMQNFVCEFSKQQLKKLIEDEKKNNTLLERQLGV